MLAIQNLTSQQLTLAETMRQEAFEAASEYLGASMSTNTEDTYKSSWGMFVQWCNKVNVEYLPASSDDVVLFISTLAKIGRKSSTISVYLAAIGKAHRTNNYEDPTDTELVHSAIKGIRRTNGTLQNKKDALTVENIRDMIATLDLNTVAGKRNRAVLLTGIFTACRREELCRLNVEDMEVTPQGLKILLRKCKTDQEGHGQIKVIVKKDNPEFCPVFALLDYLDAANITSGPLFRKVTRSGLMYETPLTDHALALIVKQMATNAGLDATKISGHSLRATFVTLADSAGASISQIMDQTGHRNVNSVYGYIRHANPFKDSATEAINI